MILDVFPKTENVTDLGTYFHVRKIIIKNTMYVGTEGIEGLSDNGTS